MNIVCKVSAVAALAVATGLGALSAPPASAQGVYHPYGFHHYYHPYGHRNYYRPGQYGHANRLSHRAAVAASHGRFYRANRFSSHAAALRAAARHGY
jgi:hypothetical protein